MTALKAINYRGGIARFRIPQSWVEEYEEAGGGTFYEDGPNTGTLRINVMDFERPDTSSHPQNARDMLAGSDSSRDVQELPSGVAVARSSRVTTERDEELRIYTWQVGVVVTPAHFRMVVFTYTILAGQERAPAMQQELQMLDRLITEGEYPSVRGVTGDYTHETAG